MTLYSYDNFTLLKGPKIELSPSLRSPVTRLGTREWILGLNRLVPVFIMSLWGHLTDRLNPRLTVVALEIAAALTSFALLKIWTGSTTNYLLFLIVCVTRSTLMNFQTGSRGKISKILSDGSYGSNAKHAIWQMRSTQGATLFAGVTGLFLVKFLSMKLAIIVDLLTFLINGILMITIKFHSEDVELAEPSLGWKQKFHDLFKYNPQAAALDIMLAISIGGLMSFMARVADGNHVWNAIFLTSYGLSVWVAGFLESSYAKKFSSTPFWIILGISYLVIGASHSPATWVLAFMFLKDISYWIILHRISGYIQADTPTKLMGAVPSARFSIMITVLSVGEILVGAWSPVVSLSMETALRAFVAIGVALYLLNRGALKTKELAHDRPAL